MRDFELQRRLFRYPLSYMNYSEAFDSLREHFGEKLLDTTIRSSIAYAESAERAVSILDYRPDLAVDYLDVAEELLARLGMDGPRRRVASLAGNHRTDSANG